MIFFRSEEKAVWITRWPFLIAENHLSPFLADPDANPDIKSPATVLPVNGKPLIHSDQEYELIQFSLFSESRM